MVIRPAIRADISEILRLIKELAVYENEPNEVINTEAKLEKDMFDKNLCEAIVAERDNQIIGFAIYYTSYSTWKGACLYLEDLYVLPEARRDNVGGQLFDALVDLAKSRDMARMDWQVLDWNELAINFYKKKSATLDHEWINGRLFFK